MEESHISRAFLRTSVSCPRVTNPRVACGVPIGTLRTCEPVRGSQGPSDTLVEWLRHSGLRGRVERLRHSACGGWLLPAGGAGVWYVPAGLSEGYKPSGEVWSTYRHSPYLRACPRVARTLGYSCGVASPLCLRVACLPAGGVPLWTGFATFPCGYGVCLWRGACQPAGGGMVWRGRRGFSVVRAVCVHTWRERAWRVACRRGVSLRVGERAGDRAAKLLHTSNRGFVTLGCLRNHGRVPIGTPLYPRGFVTLGHAGGGMRVPAGAGMRGFAPPRARWRVGRGRSCFACVGRCSAGAGWEAAMRAEHFPRILAHIPKIMPTFAVHCPAGLYVQDILQESAFPLYSDCANLDTSN